MMPSAHISVIICTRNRADSLAETLRCLRQADRRGLNAQVIVVDNGSQDDTRQVLDSFRSKLSVRYLFEPRVGKSHALNRALESAELGEIVAVLDDDMSPHRQWLQGVAAICRRWPDHDLFTGRSYVIWPQGQKPPDWALRGRIESWAFSVSNGPRDGDRPIGPGQFPQGGHFWFRSRVLAGGRRFQHLWATEPQFNLRLAEDGYRGIMGPDAVAGHRIQPQLFSEKVMRQRAALVGRSWARVRLPCIKTTKQGILLRKHPILFHLFCLASLFYWSGRFGLAKLRFSPQVRFENSLIAIERRANYLELLRIARKVLQEVNSGRIES